MHNEDTDDIVADAADAVTLNQDVQWERCARLAAPASRGVLDNLRTLSRAFASGHGSGHAAVNPALSDSEPYAGPFVRRILKALVAIAAVEVAAALALVAWPWSDFHPQQNDFGVYLTTLLVGHASTAGLLLLAGRRDRRTWLLGGYFLLKATLAPLPMLYAFLWGMLTPDMVEGYIRELPATGRLLGYLYVHPHLYAPAFLWAFARECPHIHRRTRLDDLARRMVPISLGVGFGIWIVYTVSLELVWAGHGTAAVGVIMDAGLVAEHLLALAAVCVIALRARTAPADELRRVVLFSCAFLLYMALAFAYDLVEAFSPGSWASNYAWSPYILLVNLFRFPGMLLLWYSVLAVRVPHPREVVRAFYRRLLMRGRLLAALAAAPAVAMGLLVASRPERAVGAVIADPLVLSLAAAFGTMLLLAAGRERILMRLDAWVVPETTDQRQALAAATAAVAQAGGIEALGRTVTRAIRRSCGSPAALLVAGENGTGADDFEARDATPPPLARASSIVHMLERAGGSVRVHPSDATSVFELLPPDEAAWVVDAGADAVVAVIGPGAGVIGVLVVGRRFDDRVVRCVDVAFLEAIAAAAGLGIARLRPLRASAGRSPDGPPAHECPRCGCLAAAAKARECACGSEYVETAVPGLLAGKYRLTRRLGSGGMAAVYAARDMQLQRDVAIKSLPGISVARLMGLRSEAWTMATVAHPALAQIYGIESWRGRPFLVVEFLAGGTLADRLRHGPIAPPRAVVITAALAEALAALHEARCLHRDIKPGNIAFTADGVPKLLDFGLAGEMDDAAMAGGTLHYASPEVLSGRPAGEADDVWSLCVVLYEMVSGRHPFAGAGMDEVTDRILRQSIDVGVSPGAAADPASAAARFAASILTSGRSSRPATARELAEALRGISGQDC